MHQKIALAFASLLILVLCSLCVSTKILTVKVKPTGFVSTKVAEPSDIAYDKESGLTYIVSDNGILYECDDRGKILREAEHKC